MLATPSSTPEHLARALARASAVRAARQDLVHSLEAGRATVADVFDATDEPAQTLRVVALLEAVPGVGKVAARRLAADLGITGDRPVAALSPQQKQALLGRLGR